MSALDYDVFATQCPSRDTLELVTSRWGTLILAALAADDEPTTARFSELRRRIDGISDKMLAQTLRQLQAGGLISRIEHGTLPHHVEYVLTEQGRTVAAAITELVGAVYAVQPALPD